jgi:hypothetical protein
VLLLGISTAAVGQQLPQSASSSKADAAVAMHMADAPKAAGHSTAAVHRGEQTEQKVADKKFWLTTGLMTGSTFAAMETTARCESASTCTFMDPFDSRAKIYALGLPVNFGMMELTYRLKRSGKKYWFVPAMAGTAFNTFVAVHAADRIK